MICSIVIDKGLQVSKSIKSSAYRVTQKSVINTKLQQYFVDLHFREAWLVDPNLFWVGKSGHHRTA